MLEARERSEGTGSRLEIAGGTLRDVKEIARQAGTLIEVRDLFFNTPARRKFLKSEATELARCEEAFSRIALSRPSVAFSLSHNGRRGAQLPPQDERSRAARIVGEDFAASAIEVRADSARIALRGFVAAVPKDIEEAAYVDGATPLQVCWKVLLPLIAPGLVTTGLLAFISAWNEFFFALIIMTDPTVQTLPVGIALFPGEYTMPWGEIAAASTMATIPLILLTLIFQRGIVRGLSAGAVKG